MCGAVKAQKALLKNDLRNRDGGIRTRDPLNPIQVRYRTALRPDAPQSAEAATAQKCNPTHALHQPTIPRTNQPTIHQTIPPQRHTYPISQLEYSLSTCALSEYPKLLAVLLTGPNPIDTLWIALATGLVLLMTPALGLFYGGLVRSKSILNTMMMSVASFGAVGVPWVLVGYSLAFGTGNAVLGGTEHLFMQGVGLEAKGSIPHLLFMAYQGTFAIITAALISGAVVERMRFSAYLLFISLWSVVIYAPIAHWVWGGRVVRRMGRVGFRQSPAHRRQFLRAPS